MRRVPWIQQKKNHTVGFGPKSSLNGVMYTPIQDPGDDERPNEGLDSLLYGVEPGDGETHNQDLDSHTVSWQVSINWQ